MPDIDRFSENPLITPEDILPYHEGYEVIGAFNAGVAEFNGETLLLLRVAERPISQGTKILSPSFDLKRQQVITQAYDRNDPDYLFDDNRVIRLASHPNVFCGLTSLSYFRLARSTDGHHFTIDAQPFIYPSNRYQLFGVEDSRITPIGDSYYITFSAVSPIGIGVNLVETKDFVSYQDHGLIFAPENKDVVIFPEKIKGYYYALNRPSLKSVGQPDIWIARSKNLLEWGHHQHLLPIRPGRWDGARIGAGAVPIKTPQGWLEIYHGMSADDRYCLGAVLLDLDDPTKVLARSEKPVLEPEEDYEKKGFFGEVVFTCGGIVHDRTLRLYYGVSDRSMAGVELNIDEILAELTAI